jgi:hypothetical protein
MANPNIVNVATINANNSYANLVSNTMTSLVSNPASSGKVFKINTLILTNKDGTYSNTATVNLFSAAALGGIGYPIANAISIPNASVLTLIDKGTSIYLLENQSIGANAIGSNGITAITSWEEIS